jgi:hypothetical protein
LPTSLSIVNVPPKTGVLAAVVTVVAVVATAVGVVVVDVVFVQEVSVNTGTMLAINTIHNPTPTHKFLCFTFSSFQIISYLFDKVAIM